MKRILTAITFLILAFFMTGWKPIASLSDGEVSFPSFPWPFPFSEPGPPGQPAFGPEEIPQGYNPLTGMPVEDPASLVNPPALLSITNWPVSARPQAGLSYAAVVYEIYIGDGESRFLSMFYGDYPPEITEENDGDGIATLNTQVGPLRSARLPYESLRQSYNGFLVMASGFAGVLNNLGDYNNFFGSDAGNINSAMVDVSDLKKIADTYKNKVGDGQLNSNAFDPNAPDGGLAAPDFWFIYNAFNQVHWQYDEAADAYLRFQDQGDGKTFVAATDRLTGEPLTFENVVILFADHRYCTEYAFDITLNYVARAPALLLRDGQLYKIYWTTSNSDYELATGKVRPIRYVDENGNPFPLKPGQTWVHLVPYYTAYWESTQSDVLFDLLNKPEPASGNWVSRFFASQMVYDEVVCERLR